MFVSVLDVVVEGNVFSLLIELEVGHVCQTLGEGGLAVKLVGKFPCLEHGLSVDASCLRKSGIQGQGLRPGLAARLIRQFQELLFLLRLGIEKWNVGSRRGSRLHRGWLSLLRGCGRIGWRRHQPLRGLERGESRTEQERQQ